MRVFVTGASGFIGSAVVQELLGAGHQVLGLARSDASAKAVAASGAVVHRGSLNDLDSLKRGAAESDGVIHTAFVHDFTDFMASCATDKLAIETLGAVLEGSGRPFIVSSGAMAFATEESEPGPMHKALPRKSEETGLSFATRGVRAMVVRLSPSVHGEGDHGFVATLIKTARTNGFSTFVGDGKNRWPAVHRIDAARIYRLALEKGAVGARYHGVADEGVPVKEIAEVIGRHLHVPAVSKSPEETLGLLGFIGRILSMDGPSSSKLTQEQLGWKPTQPGLIADIEQGHYFK